MNDNNLQPVRYFEAQEAAHGRLCHEEAERNGKTQEQADACDDGDVGCAACPFKTRID